MNEERVRALQDHMIEEGKCDCGDDCFALYNACKKIIEQESILYDMLELGNGVDWEDLLPRIIASTNSIGVVKDE